VTDERTSASEPRQGRPNDLVPRPDPTVLTTQQLLRELGLLRDELTREIDHVRQLTDTRMDAMDAAAALRLDELRGVREMIQRIVGALERLVDEKFSAVDLRFVERDARTRESALANKEALDAALASAKELVSVTGQASQRAADKVEVSFGAQITSIEQRFDAYREEQNQRLNALKERIDRNEGAIIGGTAGREKSVQSWGLVIGVAGAALGLLSLAAGIVIAVINAKGG
jgi:hypothetical protein